MAVSHSAAITVTSSFRKRIYGDSQARAAALFIMEKLKGRPRQSKHETGALRAKLATYCSMRAVPELSISTMS
jgi:hypothetical protein